MIKETRSYLAREENDYPWSSWRDREHALSELDSILSQLENGSIPDIEILFAPTGPLQEVSLSSGWSRQYLRLAEQFDEAYKAANSQL